MDLFIFADYISIEMRMLAYYLAQMGDYSLLNEFKAGLDPHNETAKMLGIERQTAKTLNFSIVYQGGVDTVSKQLKITKSDAAKLLKKFHGTRPGLLKLVNWVEEIVNTRSDKYVETFAGRRIHLLDTRKGLNGIIQGSAAELIKNSIINSFYSLKGYRSHLVLAVHDELGWDVHNDETKFIIDKIPDWMTDNPPITDVIDTPVAVTYSRTTWADKASLLIPKEQNLLLRG